MKITKGTHVRVKKTGKTGSVEMILSNPYNPFPEFLQRHSYNVYFDDYKLTLRGDVNGIFKKCELEAIN